MASRYKLWYETVVRSELLAKMQYKNVHQIPRVLKVSLSASTNITSGGLNHPVAGAFALELISGQAPTLTRVRTSNSRYKVRKGFLEGAKVILQGEQMYDFMDRLVTQVMPRITEFNGLKDSFDGHGNFALGIRDWGYFPEIEAQQTALSNFQARASLRAVLPPRGPRPRRASQMSSARGIGVLIHTSAESDAEAKLLLSAMRFPFRNS